MERLEKELPKGAPVFVLAESSGGITACSLALRERFRDRIAGWILCSPAVIISDKIMPNAFVRGMLKLLAAAFPTLPTPDEGVSGDTWDAAFGDGVSQHTSKTDPYVLYNVPLPLATTCAMLRALDRIKKALERGELAMDRLLVLHNRGDVRTMYQGSEFLVSRVKGQARLVDPGGNAHQLFQDEPFVTRNVVSEICSFVQNVRQDVLGK